MKLIVKWKNILHLISPRFNATFLLTGFFILCSFVGKGQDTIPPVIILNSNVTEYVWLDCSAPYIDAGATAIDNTDGDLTNSIVVTGNANRSRVGSYIITYKVKDKANNTAIQTRTVNVYVRNLYWMVGAIMDSEYYFIKHPHNDISMSSYKWYIDGKYASGHDNTGIYYYVNDTLDHKICMEAFFCQNTDTSLIHCMDIVNMSNNSLYGRIYLDSNKNCKDDTIEYGVNNIPVKLFDSSNNMISQSISYWKGSYSFFKPEGKLRMMTDTAKLPFVIACAYPGNDTIIEMKQGGKKVDFAISCKNGFDIGARSCHLTGQRPGGISYLRTWVGDMSKWYGINCASGVNGKVMIKVTGKLTYAGVVKGSLTPDSIKGNTFIYLVNDFGKIDPATAFRLMFKIDTTAQNNDTLSAEINIITTAGDFNKANNTYVMKILVRTSYDPNSKEVYPVDVAAGYSDWLTYTVNFQNTGNAPAYTVRLSDTLDGKLDLETFEMLGSSHQVQTSIEGKALMFYFKDIMLPDSNSDEPNSHGYVQYRLKPNKNLPEGTKIHNTAYIYFDYNKPVLTNTTVNEFVLIPGAGILNAVAEDNFSLFPNPNSGVFTLTFDKQDADVEIYNVYGILVYTGMMNGSKMEIDMSSFSKGFYIVKLRSGKNEFHKGMIKQ